VIVDDVIYRAEPMFTDGAVATGNLPPNAAFAFSCNGLTCDFDASGSTDDGTIVAYSWSASGVGSIGSSLTIAYPFPAAGSYTVTLTVTDDSGDPDNSTGTATAQVQAKNKGKTSGSSDSSGGGDSGGGGTCPPGKHAKGQC